jgi:hypothetical protein
VPRRPNIRPTFIYWLYDTRTGIPFYCGKTVIKLEYRLNNHFSNSLRYPTRPVSARLFEYGEGNVRIDLIETVPIGEDWAARERHWIAELRRINPSCANVSNGGDGAPGHVKSQATKELMRDKMLGRTFAPETLAKMSARMRGTQIRKGKKLSPEQSAKMSAARMGKKRGPQSAEHRAAIGASQIGKIVTEETRAAQRAAWERRRLIPISAETRAKISAAGKGRKKTEQAVANMRAAWVLRKAKDVDKSF